MAAVVLSEGLGRLAASLAGWDSARIAQDDVVWKPPGSGPVAFHQDSAYISLQFVPVSVIFLPSFHFGLYCGHVVHMQTRILSSDLVLPKWTTSRNVGDVATFQSQTTDGELNRG